MICASCGRSLSDNYQVINDVFYCNCCASEERNADYYAELQEQSERLVDEQIEKNEFNDT